MVGCVRVFGRSSTLQCLQIFQSALLVCIFVGEGIYPIVFEHQRPATTVTLQCVHKVTYLTKVKLFYSADLLLFKSDWMT